MRTARENTRTSRESYCPSCKLADARPLFTERNERRRIVAQSNLSSLHAVMPVSPKDGNRRAVVRLPTTRICVYVIGLDVLRAAGLQAIFEKNSGVDIVLGDALSLPSSDRESDSTINMVLVGTQGIADPLKTIASIRATHPALPVLVMSHTSGEEAILKVLMMGAKGFLHESSSPREFEKALHMVASGSIWAPRRIQAELIQRLLAGRDSEGHGPVARVSFTGRERQVLNLLLDGQSNREIARNLKIEERTVKSYVTKLMRKMGVTNRIALSVRAQDL